MRRETFIKSLLVTLAAPTLLSTGCASVDLKMMIPANPGGGWDGTGYALGKALQEAGVAASVSYENKGGAAGTLGLAQFVNGRKGDANAMMMMGAAMLGGIIISKPPVTLSQATPLARLIIDYNVFVLPAASPLKTMKDVVEKMKRDPGSVKWGGGLRGSTEHIAAAMLASKVGVDAAKINYVPFRGGEEAVAAILGNNITVCGGSLGDFEAHIRSGKMRVIAVTSEARLRGVDVPTLKEQGFDVVIGNWRGVYGAPGITPEQRKALTEMIVKATKTNWWAAYVERNGWLPALMLGAEFEKFVDDEFASLRATMAKAGMI